MMAGLWIKMETNLAEKPEVLLMADELEIDEDTVVGKLHRLWSWFDNNSDDGTTRLSIRFLDKIVRLDGFATAIISSGWMIESEGTLSLANWESHNGETSKRRAKESKRKGEKRLQNKGSNKSVRKVSATSRTKTGQVSANARTKCGTEQSRAEKIRAEEKKETPKPPQGAVASLPFSEGDSDQDPPEALRDLVTAWNELGNGICPICTKVDSTANLSGWKKVQKTPELRQAFSDIPLLMKKIRGSPFLHGQGFFKLSWLFGKKNHEWNVLKILEGNYEQTGNNRSTDNSLEAQRQRAEQAGELGVF